MSPCLLLVQTKRPSTLTALTRVHFSTNNKKTRRRTKPVLNLTPVKDEEAHVFPNSVSGRCGLSFFSPLLVHEDQQARVVNFDSGFSRLIQQWQQFPMVLNAGATSVVRKTSRKIELCDRRLFSEVVLWSCLVRVSAGIPVTARNPTAGRSLAGNL